MAVIWPPLPTHQHESVTVQGRNAQGVLKTKMTLAPSGQGYIHAR